MPGVSSAAVPALISSIALSRTAWTMSSLFWKWYVMTPRENARRASREPMVSASSPSSATILRAMATICPRRSSRRVSGCGMVLGFPRRNLTPESLGPGRHVLRRDEADLGLLVQELGDAAAGDLARGDEAGERRAHDAVAERARSAEDQALELGADREGPRADLPAALLGAVEIAAGGGAIMH